VSQDLPITSYALLGLLTFGQPLTGYELKQRADRTLRFYWTAPAMSQVYSELARLHRRGLVRKEGQGRGTAYSLTTRGDRALRGWLAATPVGFPVLKHPVALRLMLGALISPEETRRMLREHLDAVRAEQAALQEVRTSLAGADASGQVFHHPSMVADWGLAYLDNEADTVAALLTRLEREEADRSSR
jgi:DNA-binding PadR family transcriptional regulator